MEKLVGLLDNYKMISQIRIFQLLSAHVMFSEGRYGYQSEAQ